MKVQEAHLVAKARFLSFNTIDILDRVSLCRRTDLCIVGPLAASLASPPDACNIFCLFVTTKNVSSQY